MLFFSGFIIFLSCKNPIEEQTNYLFKELSTKQTNIGFANTLKEDKDHSIINYIYFYNGGGVAVGDINNDGLPDLYFVSNQNENKLYVNKGNLEFENVTKKANVAGNSDWSTGATMVDINNDGFLDIYVCAVSELLDFKGHNELFINNGDGTFSEESKKYGLDFKGYSTQAYFFDYDKDNDLDVYLVNHAIHTNLSHGKASQRNKRQPLVGDVLLKNESGVFKDVSDFTGIYGGVNSYGLSASISDFNNDGWDDIYVSNDFHEDDYYYINNKNGTFTEQLSTSFSTISRFSMGSDAADINADGFQDIITLDMLPNDEKSLKETEGDDAMLNMQTNLKNLGYKDQFSRNMLQINSGLGYFYETAFYNNISDTDWSWSPLIADFNNDGIQDVFISNGILRRPNSLDFKKYVSSTFKKYGEKEGVNWLFNSINEMPSGSVPNQIFKGTNTKLEDVTGNWIEKKPSLSNGAVYVDLDLDGDLDIVTNNVNTTASILENKTNNKNYLQVLLNYKEGNKEAIGSKLILHHKGKILKKEVYKSRGFLSSISSKIHFGLDTVSTIDSLKIVWPNNKVKTLKTVKVNQLLTIDFSDEEKEYSPIKINKKQVFTKADILNYVHKEDRYNDFFNERLIPYKVSTLGPAFAIGDIDKNGFDDIFVGSASGKESGIYLNNGVSFKKSKQEAIEKDVVFEDNDACFFDADNDGDLDLYVASGINENRNNNFEYDRLYINNNSIFTRAKEKIIFNPLNTSTVTSSDFDKDGDTDLFIGNLSNPLNYGEFVNSAVLRNKKGVLNADPKYIINSKITQSSFQDINNDGFDDLLIATEWDAPIIFINNNGELEKIEIPKNLNGLWQSITAFDIDNDGDKDIVLGNWGENTKLQKYIENPIYLYFGDFDGNNKKESIIAYKVGDNYYPLNTKDELASQMNIISKRFVNHKDFALQPIEKVLTEEKLKGAIKRQIDVLSSGYLENNNGTFNKFVKLDSKLQMGPINHFLNLEMNNSLYLIVSGNSEKPSTYHGYYNSLKGFLVKNNTEVKELSALGVEPFNKQIKQTAVVKMKDKNLLFVLANNDSLKTYTFKK